MGGKMSGAVEGKPEAKEDEDKGGNTGLGAGFKLNAAVS